MGRSIEVPITGEVLGWAMREGGFTAVSFGDRVGATADTVRAWIAETERPSKTQFNTIVDVLRRPSAMFFLVEPPTQAGVPPSFRKAPGSRNVTPHELIEIRWALGLQEIAAELLAEQEGEPVQFLAARSNETPADAADRLRTSMGIPGNVPRKWKDPADAFNTLKKGLETVGVLVFQLQLKERGEKEPGIRGFSSWNDYAPLLAVNTGYNPAAKLYSLVHELGHLMSRSDSSCLAYSGPGSAKEPGSERWCELFAAAFLLPESRVAEYMAGLGYARDGDLTDAGEVARIAGKMHVSIRAMALRLIDLGYSPKGLYGVIERDFPTSDRKGGKSFGPTRDRVARRIAETGPRLGGLLVDGVRRQSLSLRESASYLRVHPSEMRTLERRLAS
jgi:Zn-dependent peptidase ImmA (M78 family)